MSEYAMIGLSNKIVLDYLDKIKNNKVLESRYTELLCSDLIKSATKIHRMILEKISEKIADDIANELFEKVKEGGEK